jgi:hypothetical protein
MDPKLTRLATQKLDQLLRTNPEADIAGVLLRVDTQIVTITREGCVQWFEQDTRGAIKKDTEADPRSPSQTMADINRKHGRNSQGE